MLIVFSNIRRALLLAAIDISSSAHVALSYENLVLLFRKPNIATRLERENYSFLSLFVFYVAFMKAENEAILHGE